VIYLDSSALMKLIRTETETAALRDWLATRADQPMVTSEVGRVEVIRAARRVGGPAVLEARAVVDDIDRIVLDRAVQDLASDISDPLLRTLDALHLASAVLLGADLAVFVAYDHRLTCAAQTAGLAVATPGRA
jgi:predicted nucleic acid-binding protein